MYRALVCLGLFLGSTGVTAIAGAQPKTAPPSPKFAVPGSPASVSAGSKEGHARARASFKSQGAALATFPGFRLLPDGRSRIYVELTKSVSVDERRADGMLIYVLHGARVPVRNNRNALITTHFATPVARARLLTSGGDVELIIDLRKAANATQKVVPAENGAARLEIDFPAGDYPPVPGLFEPPAARAKSNESADEGEAESPPAPAVTPPSAPGTPPAPPRPAPNRAGAAPSP